MHFDLLNVVLKINKNISIATMSVAMISYASMPTFAQVNTPNLPQNNDPNNSFLETGLKKLISLNRAKNLARQTAEKANGGLGKYRSESSMYGPVEESPFTENSNGTVTFKIKGRTIDSSEYTILTIVTVNNNDGTVTIEYNGPIR